VLLGSALPAGRHLADAASPQAGRTDTHSAPFWTTVSIRPLGIG
jgi:hypothetical protein